MTKADKIRIIKTFTGVSLDDLCSALKVDIVELLELMNEVFYASR